MPSPSAFMFVHQTFYIGSVSTTVGIASKRYSAGSLGANKTTPDKGNFKQLYYDTKHVAMSWFFCAQSCGDL